MLSVVGSISHHERGWLDDGQKKKQTKKPTILGFRNDHYKFLFPFSFLKETKITQMLVCEVEVYLGGKFFFSGHGKLDIAPNFFLWTFSQLSFNSAGGLL